MSAAVGASLWTALIAAWIWYGPGWLRRRHRRTIAWPSAIRLAIPEAAVLVGQQHELAVGGRAGGPARLDEQHEREQSHDLGFVGHQLGQQPSEADGLRAEVLADEPVARARRVALVEDEVDDGQHGPQAVREVGLVRDAVGDPRVADLALGPDQPLGHGRLGHQEGARDLGGGEPAQEPQRQRDLGAGGERGVTAGEDQAQPVVAHGALLGRFVAGVQQSGLGVPVLAGRLPAQAVDRPVAGGGDDPSRRARRQSVGRPPLHRRGERVLDRLLGDVDVAEDADQDGHRAAVLLAEHTLDLRGGDGPARRVSVPGLALERPHLDREGGRPGRPCGPTRARRRDRAP